MRYGDLVRAVIGVSVLALAGCAARVGGHVTPGMSQPDVSSIGGAPAAEGKLATGERYWDYTLQPSGYFTWRVVFGTDGRVTGVHNLLTERNILNLKTGMNETDVAQVLGPSLMREGYWRGDYSVAYRFMENATFMLLTVQFTRDGHLSYYYWEPDPAMYSAPGGDTRG